MIQICVHTNIQTYTLCLLEPLLYIIRLVKLGRLCNLRTLFWMNLFVKRIGLL